VRNLSSFLSRKEREIPNPDKAGVRNDKLFEMLFFAVPGRAQPATVGLPASGSDSRRNIARVRFAHRADFSLSF
jgi:hypothetical protein